MKKLTFFITAVIIALILPAAASRAEIKNNQPNAKMMVTDSLDTEIQNMQTELSLTAKQISDLNIQLMTTHEQLNTSQTNLHNKVIYIIALICIVMLISLLLILLVWTRFNRRLSNLTEDHEKTIEALNLHIKNTSEEISALNEALSGSDKKN